MAAATTETVRNESGTGQSRRNCMALLRFSPESASIVERKETISGEGRLKLRANHENDVSALPARGRCAVRHSRTCCGVMTLRLRVCRQRLSETPARFPHVARQCRTDQPREILPI